MTEGLARRLAAEACGSVLLSAAVIGSGIMGARLAGGNAAVALLANTGATVAALGVLISLLAPASGAHFNPAVSLVMALHRRVTWSAALAYIAVQVAGCCAGAMLAHLMFELPLLQTSTHVRGGPSQWVSEMVATSGLLLVVLGHRRGRDAPWLVAAWIGAAYWFTASTSFANPAITIARSLTDTFAGIRPSDVPPFVMAQLVGAVIGVGLSRLTLGRERAYEGARPRSASS
jgi:glycerol uptake facilitator-like aquaporin